MMQHILFIYLFKYLFIDIFFYLGSECMNNKQNS